MILDRLPGLYRLKYDSVTGYRLPLYLYSYKLDGSATRLTSKNGETSFVVLHRKKLSMANGETVIHLISYGNMLQPHICFR